MPNSGLNIQLQTNPADTDKVTAGKKKIVRKKLTPLIFRFTRIAKVNGIMTPPNGTLSKTKKIVFQRDNQTNLSRKISTKFVIPIHWGAEKRSHLVKLNKSEAIIGNNPKTKNPTITGDNNKYALKVSCLLY